MILHLFKSLFQLISPITDFNQTELDLFPSDFAQRGERRNRIELELLREQFDDIDDELIENEQNKGKQKNQENQIHQNVYKRFVSDLHLYNNSLVNQQHQLISRNSNYNSKNHTLQLNEYISRINSMSDKIGEQWSNKIILSIRDTLELFGFRLNAESEIRIRKRKNRAQRMKRKKNEDKLKQIEIKRKLKEDKEIINNGNKKRFWNSFSLNNIFKGPISIKLTDSDLDTPDSIALSQSISQQSLSSQNQSKYHSLYQQLQSFNIRRVFSSSVHHHVKHSALNQNTIQTTHNTTSNNTTSNNINNSNGNGNNNSNISIQTILPPPLSYETILKDLFSLSRLFISVSLILIAIRLILITSEGEELEYNNIQRLKYEDLQLEQKQLINETLSNNIQQSSKQTIHSPFHLHMHHHIRKLLTFFISRIYVAYNYSFYYIKKVLKAIYSQSRTQYIVKRLTSLLNLLLLIIKILFEFPLSLIKKILSEFIKKITFINIPDTNVPESTYQIIDENKNEYLDTTEINENKIQQNININNANETDILIQIEEPKTIQSDQQKDQLIQTQVSSYNFSYLNISSYSPSIYAPSLRIILYPIWLLAIVFHVVIGILALHAASSMQLYEQDDEQKAKQEREQKMEKKKRRKIDSLQNNLKSNSFTSTQSSINSKSSSQSSSSQQQQQSNQFKSTSLLISGVSLSASDSLTLFALAIFGNPFFSLFAHQLSLSFEIEEQKQLEIQLQQNNNMNGEAQLNESGIVEEYSSFYSFMHAHQSLLQLSKKLIQLIFSNNSSSQSSTLQVSSSSVHISSNEIVLLLLFEVVLIAVSLPRSFTIIASSFQQDTLNYYSPLISSIKLNLKKKKTEKKMNNLNKHTKNERNSERKKKLMQSSSINEYQYKSSSFQQLLILFVILQLFTIIFINSLTQIAKEENNTHFLNNIFLSIIKFISNNWLLLFIPSWIAYFFAYLTTLSLLHLKISLNLKFCETQNENEIMKDKDTLTLKRLNEKENKDDQIIKTTILTPKVQPLSISFLTHIICIILPIIICSHFIICLAHDGFLSFIFSSYSNIYPINDSQNISPYYLQNQSISSVSAIICVLFIILLRIGNNQERDYVIEKDCDELGIQKKKNENESNKQNQTISESQEQKNSLNNLPFILQMKQWVMNRAKSTVIQREKQRIALIDEIQKDLSRMNKINIPFEEKRQNMNSNSVEQEREKWILTMYSKHHSKEQISIRDNNNYYQHIIPPITKQMNNGEQDPIQVEPSSSSSLSSPQTSSSLSSNYINSRYGNLHIPKYRELIMNEKRQRILFSQPEKDKLMKKEKIDLVNHMNHHHYSKYKPKKDILRRSNSALIIKSTQHEKQKSKHENEIEQINKSIKNNLEKELDDVIMNKKYKRRKWKRSHSLPNILLNGQINHYNYHHQNKKGIKLQRNQKHLHKHLHLKAQILNTDLSPTNQKSKLIISQQISPVHSNVQSDTYPILQSAIEQKRNDKHSTTSSSSLDSVRSISTSTIVRSLTQTVTQSLTGIQKYLQTKFANQSTLEVSEIVQGNDHIEPSNLQNVPVSDDNALSESMPPPVSILNDFMQRLRRWN